MSAEKPLAYEKTGDNKIAETEDPTKASVVQPWNPDPKAVPGTPPVGGKDGERGSSAFKGTGLFEDDNTIGDKVPDTHYPLHGVDYWQGSTPTGNHS